MGGRFGLAGTTSSMELNSRLPSWLQIAAARSQRRSAGMRIVTGAHPAGVTEIAQILPELSTAPTLDTTPPVTRRT